MMLLRVSLIVSVAAVIHAADKEVVSDVISIGSFNVQRLGVNKVNDPFVLSILVQIFDDYDICNIMEVVDVSGEAMVTLLNKMNEGTTDNPWKMEQSPRVGTDGYKEQYVYLYNSKTVSLSKAELYPDPGNVFIREPYVATFTANARAVSEFTIIPIHTRPTDAVSEISNLVKVNEWTVNSFGGKDVIIMGDFNADCSYVSGSDWDDIELFTNKDYTWLIGNDADTTCGQSSCAYDRFVTYGPNINAAIDMSSVEIRLFEQEFGLTEEQMLDVSDHYPIQLNLIPKVSSTAIRNVECRQSISALDKYAAATTAVTSISKQTTTTGFDISTLYDGNGNLVKVVALGQKKRRGISGVMDDIKTIHAEYPGLLSDWLVAVMKYKLEFGAMDDSTVYVPQSWYSHTLEVICNLPDYKCSVVVSKTVPIA